MHNQKQAVAATGLLVAAMRAKESEGDNPLFIDQFAELLAGAEGRQLLAAYLKATGLWSPPIIEVRTRFYDEALQLAAAGGARQVVILAAGRDARAYRLAWPSDTTVFEIDQPEVITAKDTILADEKPRCRRVPVGIDLADDWGTALRARGLIEEKPTVWLAEGLLQYLDAAAVRVLFDRIDLLSTVGSQLLYDVVGNSLLRAPFLAPTLDFMADLGAPWVFASDEPAALSEQLGWTATLNDIAETGAAWHRWPSPPIPLSVPDVPRGYLVRATKERK